MLPDQTVICSHYNITSIRKTILWVTQKKYDDKVYHTETSFDSQNLYTFKVYKWQQDIIILQFVIEQWISSARLICYAQGKT